MHFEKKDLELTDEFIVEMVTTCRKYMSNGIYVPCDHHICGYDFISFEDIVLDKDDEDYEEYGPVNFKVESAHITDGIYDNHPYEDKTLKEILKLTNMKFELER